MRIVLVTGGASGIGYGTGAAFAAAGDRVILTDAREEVGRVRAEEIGARFLPLDVADPDSVADALAALEADGTELDVLVHSAGLVSGGGPLLDLPVEDFDTCVAVNLRGTFLVLRAVGDHLRRHGRGGAIVTVSSAGARQPTPGLGHYEATKAGVEALTRSAAIEFAPHGIRVNAVAPGPVLTPMTAGLVADPHARAAWEARIPLGTIAEVPDVVAAITFLAAPASRHITGVSLAVEGGQLLT